MAKAIKNDKKIPSENSLLTTVSIDPDCSEKYCAEKENIIIGSK